MALVTERWSPQAVQYSSGGFSAYREFDVTGVSTQNDAIGAVIAFDSSTRLNEEYPGNPWLYCSGPGVARPSLNVWLVRVPYQSSPAGRHPDPGNPLGEPIIWNWQQCSFSAGVDTNAAGRLLTDVNGSPFNDVQEDFIEIRATARRNEPIFDAKRALEYINSVNNATVSFNKNQWKLFKGQSKVGAIVPLSDMTEASPYVTVQYSIVLRAGFIEDTDGYWDGFKLRILNQGKNGYYNDSGTKKRGKFVVVQNGQITAQDVDVMLNADGTPFFSGVYKVQKQGGTGFAEPFANPGLPTGMVLEMTSSGVVFIKEWPRSTKLKNHVDLNLS